MAPTHTLSSPLATGRRFKPYQESTKWEFNNAKLVPITVHFILDFVKDDFLVCCFHWSNTNQEAREAQHLKLLQTNRPRVWSEYKNECCTFACQTHARRQLCCENCVSATIESRMASQALGNRCMRRCRYQFASLSFVHRHQTYDSNSRCRTRRRTESRPHLRPHLRQIAFARQLTQPKALRPRDLGLLRMTTPVCGLSWSMSAILGMAIALGMSGLVHVFI